MFIFYQAFTAKSKKTNEPFYNVTLFERRTTQDKKVYFKETSIFVDKDVFDAIVKQGFNFGDVVEVQTAPPLYFGGSEQLVGLKLVAQSPYIELSK